MDKLYKGIIFDLDGTLADTLDDITFSLNEMLKANGYPTHTRADVYNYINNGARNLVKRALPNGVTDDEIDRCVGIYDGIYREHYLDAAYLYDGIADMCRTLKENGIRMAVLSNKQHALVDAIVTRLLPDTFCAVMGQSTMPHKPDPTAPLYIAEKIMGVGNDEVVFCGDSDVDMKTGKNSGMLSVGVSWGYRSSAILTEAGADMIVDSAEEIINIILKG